MAIKKGDFIEIAFTGMLDDGMVFDTTDEKTAKESGIHNANSEYGNLIMCVGEGHVLSGLDTKLIGKETGKEYDFRLTAEEGFGKKDTKLLRLIATSKFTKQNIMPQPGLQVSIDEIMGTIKSVTSGRVIVDLNHPLSGRALEYKVKIGRLVTDSKEKANAILKMRLGIRDAEITINESACAIKLKSKVPKTVLDTVTEEIKRLCGFSSVEYTEPEEKKAESAKEPEKSK
ncbi:MAG: peptidylprolyl isomerase [Candidatus Woesearchaeota archaeon]|nr:peptidylprolyl isomerase [Candidatus Woesearchaeota archaeon]